MNIVEIKTGGYYDPEYSEYRFKTNLTKRDIYDENLNLTPWFLEWLKTNYHEIYWSYINDLKNFEIIYLHYDELETIE